MNLQEFAALKAGDKIRNEITQSAGEVTEAAPGGVRVRWGTGPEFAYPVNGTSWFHWSKVDAEPEQ
jgi:hypothetical protein